MIEKYFEPNYDSLENLKCTECGKKIKREKFKISHICKDYVEKDTSNLVIVCSECTGNNSIGEGKE